MHGACSADGPTMRAIWAGFVACLLLATGALAGQLTGRWKAEVEGRHGGSMALTMDLVDDDDGLVTGTVRGPRGEAAISSGNLDGDDLTFSVITEFDGYQIRQHYRGTVEGDVIHFSLTVEDGHSVATPVHDFQAKRVAR